MELPNTQPNSVPGSSGAGSCLRCVGHAAERLTVIRLNDRDGMTAAPRIAAVVTRIRARAASPGSAAPVTVDGDMTLPAVATDTAYSRRLT